MITKMLGFLFCAWLGTTAHISAANAVSTVKLCLNNLVFIVVSSAFGLIWLHRSRRYKLLFCSNVFVTQSSRCAMLVRPSGESDRSCARLTRVILLLHFICPTTLVDSRNA